MRRRPPVPADSLESCRAIIIEAAGQEAAEGVAGAAQDLGRHFRLVLAAPGKRGPPRVVPPPFNAWIAADCISSYVRENAIEWYASWLIGSAPDIGFRGALRGGSPAEVQAALRAIRRAEAHSRIVIDYERLDRVTASLRKRKGRIVFTNGVFDLLHAGHLRLLETARARGDALIVAINSDDSTRAIKGSGRPVVPQFARAGLLSSLRCVDACFIFPEADPGKALETVKPDVLVKGSEYPLRKIVGARFVLSYGGEVVRVPMVAGWSTTSTIRAVQSTR
ncbi:MAG: adenylyltransferase/cytidyltransferase family protein [Spirochaetia bacterium]